MFKTIAENGNTSWHHNYHQKVLPSEIMCRDGFTMHVHAGQMSMSLPSVTPCNGESDEHPSIGPFWEKDCEYGGPYSNFQVSNLSEVPPNFSDWMNYIDQLDEPKGFYGNVPKRLVEDLIAFHGGEL